MCLSMWGRRGARVAGWLVEQQQYNKLTRRESQQEQSQQYEQQQRLSLRPTLRDLAGIPCVYGLTGLPS